METSAPHVAPAASGDHRAGTLAFWLVALTATLAYLPSLSGPFIFDDLTSIPDNPTLRALWPLGLVLSPPSFDSDLPEAIKDRVRDFIMAYGVSGSEHETRVLAALGWAPFRPSTNEQLLPIRQLELFKTRLKLTGDSILEESERTRKLAEIDAALAALKGKIQAHDELR